MLELSLDAWSVPWGNQELRDVSELSPPPRSEPEILDSEFVLAPPPPVWFGITLLSNAVDAVIGELPNDPVSAVLTAMAADASIPTDDVVIDMLTFPLFYLTSN